MHTTSCMCQSLLPPTLLCASAQSMHAEPATLTSRWARVHLRHMHVPSPRCYSHSRSGRSGPDTPDACTPRELRLRRQQNLYRLRGCGASAHAGAAVMPSRSGCNPRGAATACSCRAYPHPLPPPSAHPHPLPPQHASSCVRGLGNQGIGLRRQMCSGLGVRLMGGRWPWAGCRAALCDTGCVKRRAEYPSITTVPYENGGQGIRHEHSDAVVHSPCVCCCRASCMCVMITEHRLVLSVAFPVHPVLIAVHHACGMHAAVRVAPHGGRFGPRPVSR